MAKATSKTVVGKIDYASLDTEKLHELGVLLIPGFDPGDYTKAGLPSAIARQAKRKKLDSDKAIEEFLSAAYDKAWGDVDDEDERDQTFEEVTTRLRKSGSRVDLKKYSEDSEQDRMSLIKMLHRRRNKEGHGWSLEEIDDMTGSSGGVGGRPIPIKFDIEDGFDSIPTDAPDGVSEDAVDLFKLLQENAGDEHKFECGRTSTDGKRPAAVARWRGMTVQLSLSQEFSTAYDNDDE